MSKHPLTHGRAQGFSIIELMVAVFIASVIFAAVAELFINSKHSYSIQEESSLMHENGRTAIRLLTESIRMAGHWGGVEGSDISGTGNNISSCDASYLKNIDNAIRGWDGAATITAAGNPPSGCITYYVPETDLLISRYASDKRVADGSVADGSLTEKTNYVRSAEGLCGEMKTGKEIKNSASCGDYNNATPDGSLDNPYTYNYPYKAELYYLRPCSVVTNNNNCNDGIPTLVRKIVSGSTVSEQPLINFVEHLQFEYGSDTDQDNSVNRYDDASAVPDWDDVLTVRIALIVRADKREPAFLDSKTYDLFGDGVGIGSDYTPSGSNQEYHRKLFSGFVRIRNRGQE